MEHGDRREDAGDRKVEHAEDAHDGHAQAIPDAVYSKTAREPREPQEHELVRTRTRTREGSMHMWRVCICTLVRLYACNVTCAPVHKRMPMRSVVCTTRLISQTRT